MATAQMVAEEIRRMYYKFAPQQDGDLDERDVLFHVFNTACQYAVQDAGQNAKADEGYYANDQFFFKYTLPIQADGDGKLYAQLPSAPVSLAGNREIDHIFFPGAHSPAIFINARQRSHIGYLQRLPGILCFLDDMRLYFDKNGYAKQILSVSFNLICAGSDPSVELNLPASYIPQLIQSVFKLVLAEKGLLADTTNDKKDD